MTAAAGTAIQAATSYAYDDPGNLALVTDQAGNKVQYVYDLNNQLRSVVQVAIRTRRTTPRRTGTTLTGTW